MSGLATGVLACSIILAMSYDVHLSEELWGYERTNYERWGTDLAFVDASLAVTGTLGCDVSRYRLQSPKSKGYQHFPEVEAARHLVTHQQIPKGHIQYENYYLSGKALATASPDGKKIQGTQLLQQALTPRFFELFDDLYDKNSSPGDVSASRVHVDLFVLDSARRIASFWEIKKVSPEKTTHEGVANHQKLCLAILRYLFAEKEKEVFLFRGWRGIVRLAVFVTQASLLTHMYSPRVHRVQIRV